MLASANRHFLTPTLNAAANDESRQLVLWRIPYLAVHKETSAEAPQEEKKLSQRLSKRCFFFSFFLLSVASRGRGRTVEGSENSHFRQAASLWMREESRKVHLQFLSISDRLQTVSERLRACSSCACTQNGAESADYSRRVTARGANDDEEPHPEGQSPWLLKWEGPPPRLVVVLLTRLLTVHWIKQQSELGSSLHWDVGHWLQPIHSGKIREAWRY